MRALFVLVLLSGFNFRNRDLCMLKSMTTTRSQLLHTPSLTGPRS